MQEDAANELEGRLPGLVRKAAPPLILMAAALALHAGTLRIFWLVDDTQFLKHVVQYRCWEDVIIPPAWQALTRQHYTPWLTCSYGLDWSLFGLQPIAFHLHHLLSLCVLAVTAYAVLRLWFQRTPSLFGVLAFLGSPPVVDAAVFLMIRHYIEGMILSLASVYCFVRTVRGGGTAFRLLTPLLYLGACLAKEQYVPLVFLLLLLPEGDLRRRARAVLTSLAALVAYLALRRFMIGDLIGGFGPTLMWPDDVLLLLPRMAASMGSGLEGVPLAVWFIMAGLSTLLAFAILLITNRPALYRMSGVALLVLLPLVPVSPWMTGRYVFIVTLAWLVLHLSAAASAWSATGRRAVRIGTVVWCVVIFAFCLYAGRANHTRLQKDVTIAGMEGAFVLEQGAGDDLLIGQYSPQWYFEGLFWLREHVLKLPPGPSVMVGSELHSPGTVRGDRFTRIWQYDPARNGLTATVVAPGR